MDARVKTDHLAYVHAFGPQWAAWRRATWLDAARATRTMGGSPCREPARPRRATDARGRLDAAHNNAGVPGPYVPLDEYEEEDFLRVLQVDLAGVWRCMRAEIRHMRTQGSGAIVNTSSMLGAAAMPDNSAYVAAKHAVHGLTRAAALELGGTGVRVNAIAPGVTRTGMTSAVSDELLARVPLGRIAEPEEIAAAAVWLCSPQASYITGSVLAADGGWLAG